jgi:hypothetical protein
LDQNSWKTEVGRLWVKMSAYCRQDMEYADLTDSNTILNKVQVDLHMLGTLVLNRIVGEVDSTYVVTIN